MKLEEKERVEIDFWLNSETEKPEADSLDNLLNKMTDAPVFLERMRPFRSLFQEASAILELGAGQGWASCIVKREFPRAHVTATDISEHAIASLPKWEHVFRVRVDHALPCRSYDVPLPDCSIDLIFCFAAAHHFVAHRRTLREIHRLLRPGGNCFYFHEPSCNRLLHSLARWRVNRIRPEVPEDILIHQKIAQLAREAGLQTALHPDTSLLKRGAVEMLYYYGLRRLPFLQRFLPCTRDFQFTKQRQ